MLFLINHKSIKMKTNIFTLLLTTLVFGFTFGQDITSLKGGGVLDIITILPSDGYSDMVFEGQISGYGTVYVAFKAAYNELFGAWDVDYNKYGESLADDWGFIRHHTFMPELSSPRN